MVHMPAENWHCDPGVFANTIFVPSGDHDGKAPVTPKGTCPDPFPFMTKISGGSVPVLLCR
jgi:hypothetical protein